MPESHPDIQTVNHMYGAACASPQTSDHGARALTLKAHSELGESSRVRALRPDAGRIPSGKRRRRSNLLAVISPVTILLGPTDEFTGWLRGLFLVTRQLGWEGVHAADAAERDERCNNAA